MAWQNYGWAWSVAGVQGSEYVVLLYLAQAAGEDGETPLLAVQQIARNCNLSRRSVFAHIKKLESKGFIQRKHRWAKGVWDANAFQMNLTRFFPLGSYHDATDLWQQILRTIPTDEIKDCDLRILNLITEAFLQKNARTLYLLTATDVYEEVLLQHLPHLKKAANLLKIPIRRFEAYPKPRFPHQRKPKKPNPRN